MKMEMGVNIKNYQRGSEEGREGNICREEGVEADGTLGWKRKGR